MKSFATGPQRVAAVAGQHASWDAAVIGAGPAGSLTACLLARQGVRTLLVERRSWPRYKVCGACINRRALAILGDAGLEHLLDKLPSSRQRQFELAACRRRLTVRLPDVVAVARADFDAALAAAAIEAGACFLPETEAKLLPQPGEHAATRHTDSGGHDSRGPTQAVRHLRLRDRQGRQRVIAAAVVVAADGLAHPSLTECGQFVSRVRRGSSIGVGAVLEDVPASYDGQSIFMAVGPRRLCRTGPNGRWAMERGCRRTARVRSRRRRAGTGLCAG